MTQKQSKKEALLTDIYYNYGSRGALVNTPEKLVKIARSVGGAGSNINASDVKSFLGKQPSYTVHRRLTRKQFPRRKIVVNSLETRADVDLIELGDLAPWNSGFRFILTVIDTCSRFVWARAIKKKEAKVTGDALRDLIEKEKFYSILLYSDGGREFSGAPFQSVLREYGILHRVCTSEDFHCPFVERVIRTVKENLFQAMTTKRTRTWIGLLPLILSTYNSTDHSATNMTPLEARKPENYLKLLNELKGKRLAYYEKYRGRRTYRFKVGDLVRILKGGLDSLGRKGYLPRFTWEIFRIKKLANDYNAEAGEVSIPAYVLEDLNGEVIEHALFYEEELSGVDASQLSADRPVREILARRGNQVKVWFHGEAKSKAAWIDRNKLV